MADKASARIHVGVQASVNFEVAGEFDVIVMVNGMVQIICSASG